VNTVISETQNAVGKLRFKAKIYFAITNVHILSKFQVYEQSDRLCFKVDTGKQKTNKQTNKNKYTKKGIVNLLKETRFREGTVLF